MEEARVSDCELTTVGYKWVFDSAPAGIRSAKPGYVRAFVISRGRRRVRIRSLVPQSHRGTVLDFWRQVCAFLVAPFIYFNSPRRQNFVSRVETISNFRFGVEIGLTLDDNETIDSSVALLVTRI